MGAKRLEACGRADAGGRGWIAGLLTVAKRRGLRIDRRDLRNSGDTAGGRDRVVGYGAWAVSQAASPAKPDVKSDPASADKKPAATTTRVSAAKPATKSRSEEHTSELQSLMRTSYAVFCLKKK